ncbi:hypothetical protein GQ457_05G026530 [Hibiscus cannabinus]
MVLTDAERKKRDKPLRKSLKKKISTGVQRKSKKSHLLTQTFGVGKVPELEIRFSLGLQLRSQVLAMLVITLSFT